MKAAALIIISVIYLLFVKTVKASSIVNNVKSEVNGGNASSYVKINNNIGTDSDSKTTSTTKTSIEIQQTGNGTSEVTVNGKDYKVKGTGNLSVNETSDNSSDKTENDNESAETTPTTIEELPTPDMVSEEVVKPQTYKEKVEAKINELKESIRKIFSNFLK